MAMLTRTRWRFKPSFASKKGRLIHEIKHHPAWRGELSLCEAAFLLKNQPFFTFLISQGMDECHFFLSYVDFQGTVKHKNVRILPRGRDWVVKNGGMTEYESIVPLIPNCLKCSKDIPKALIS